MNRWRRLSWLITALISWISVAVNPCAADHPLHYSRATVEFNAETSSFEVSLCVFQDDLADALEKRLGRRIDWKSDQETDAVLRDYVRSQFELRVDGAPIDQEWVGFEAEQQQVWLYFEFPLSSASPNQVGVRNTIFMDQFEDQLNVAYVKVGERQRCMTFRTDLNDWQDWTVRRESKTVQGLPPQLRQPIPPDAPATALRIEK